MERRPSDRGRAAGEGERTMLRNVWLVARRVMLLLEGMVGGKSRRRKGREGASEEEAVATDDGVGRMLLRCRLGGPREDEYYAGGDRRTRMLVSTVSGDAGGRRATRTGLGRRRDRAGGREDELLLFLPR